MSHAVASRLRSLMAVIVLAAGAGGAHAFTIDDFTILSPHVNPFDEHEVFFPDFNNFELEIHGTFDATKCYQVTIKREGNGICGSANSSGSDDAIVTATKLTADVSPNAAADFKGATDWRISVIERTGPGCTGSSTEVIYGDDAGETPLSIAGCNQTCLLTPETMTLTPDPSTAGCGDTVELCASSGGSGNLKYEFDTDGDGNVDVTKLVNDITDPAPCMEGAPCCISYMPSASGSPSVAITDLGTNVACATEVATTVTVVDDCEDGEACNGVSACVAGACQVTTPAPDCSGLDDQCNTGVCQGGSCVAEPKTDGTSCNDGDACTQTDTCQGGSCDGTNPVVCTAQDQCHVAGVCDPASGVCSNPTKQDGSSCNDGNACTQTDTCQGGSCDGANPVVCTALDQCHVPGVCNPANGTCSNPTKEDGSSCSDGNPCTLSDTCEDGTCAPGGPKTCNPLDACHDAGTCNPADGVCSNPPKPAGFCNDQNVCTIDSCNPQTGCVNQTVSCNDGNACTTDSCDAVTGCQHGPVTCDDGSFCTTDSCIPATGCRYVFDPSLNERCTETHACRSPGFWGTHAGEPDNLAQDVIDDEGGCLEVCGEVIADTAVGSADSVIEGICVSPRGDIRLQLARQLTAMSLNCAMNGFGFDCSGHVRFAPLFAECSAACAMSTTDVGDCIAMIDCFNNGGEADPATLLCYTDTIANCHIRPLPAPYDDYPAGASSSQSCSQARKNACTVLLPGETSGCTSGTRIDSGPEMCLP